MARSYAWEALTCLVLYIAAFAGRSWTRASHAWADEAAFYATARTLGNAMDNAVVLDTDQPADPLRWLFWQRIAFSIAMHPAAAIGFDAFRTWHVVLASLLPVLAFVMVRRLSGHFLTASLAGGIVALHPQFVVWGSRAFPDTLMTLAFGAAVLAGFSGRHGTAAVLFVLSCWVKEQAYFGVAVLFAVSMARGRLAGQIRLWPPSLRLAQSQYVPALLMGLLPVGYALSIGGPFPGWNRGGSYVALLDHLFLTLWFLPVVLLGLVSARSRDASITALAFPAFFVLYRMTGRGAGPNYYVVTAFLAVVAVAVTLSALPSLLRAAQETRRPVAASVFGFLIVLGVPAGFAFHHPEVVTVGPGSEHDLLWVLRDEMTRDDVLWEAVEAAHRPNATLFALDLAWFWGPHPVADAAEGLRVGCTCWAIGEESLPRYVRTIEGLSDVTLLQKESLVLNRALQEAYGDCASFSNERFLVIEGPACAGRLERVQAAYQELSKSQS